MAPPPPRHSRDIPATTGRSASAPGTGTQSLAGSSRSGCSLRPPQGPGMSRNAFSRFRARAADRAHVTYTPDTTWPVNGHPPGSSRAGDIGPVLMPSKQLRRFTSDPRYHGDCAPSSRSPPDASCAPFPHRSPRRSSANAACGGLQPPTAGRLRRAKPSSPAQHHVQKLYLQTELPSMFVAHVGSQNWCHIPI